MMEGKLTVFYDPPYWVGIFERIEIDQYQTIRFVFGSEPTEPELLSFALTRFSALKFSKPVLYDPTDQHYINYKRRMRKIRNQMKEPHKSTHAQEILQQEYETRAVERKKNSKEDRLKENEHKYQLRKARQAEKHRGH
jgi:hypothetical protein